MAVSGAAIGSFWVLSFPGSAARWDGMDCGSTIATVFLSLLPVQQGKLPLSWIDTTHLHILLHISERTQFRAIWFSAQWMQSTKYEGNKHTAFWDIYEPPFSNKSVFFCLFFEFLHWRNKKQSSCSAKVSKRSSFTALSLTDPSLGCNARAEQKPVFLKQTQTVHWLTLASSPTLLGVSTPQNTEQLNFS